MSIPEQFTTTMQQGYVFKGPSILLGAPLLNGECPPGTQVRIPLRTMNRHGLIAGATGTGKTKTLQALAEQLSLNGVPTLLMDIKGDLSGLASPASATDKFNERHQKIGEPWAPQNIPVELLTLSNEPGARLRATISEFGPVLLGRILELNDTQQSVLALVFKYCDDNGLALLDIKDLRRSLQYITQEGKAAIQKEYGAVSPATVNIILRKLIEIEQQGAERFFGERSFDPQDLLQVRDGKGVVSIVRLTDIQDKPRLFSTFMLCLLAEIYNTFPEQGDADKPKLVLFIDEAHLIFDTATKALLDQIETIIKLIRSKGVGVYFCTQDPSDVPENVLGQLGLKVQHALRAFTAKDRTTIKKTAQNYPETEFYNVESLLTSLGIGEALVTALSEKGTPTPLAHTLLRTPGTRMDVLSSLEIDGLVARSTMAKKYNEAIDRESAFEILEQRIKAHQEEEDPAAPAPKPKAVKEEPSTLEKISKNTLVRQVARTGASALMRGLLGVLGIKATRSRTARR
ncbi:MAG TPA: helicase HerA-like domain-containing protein [Flavobacteriales bacterium]